MTEIAGLVKIIPSSVVKTGASSTASISASGKVTFGLCESLSVNDVFSATYDNYMIILKHIGSVSSAGLALRFRISGSDYTGTDYIEQYFVPTGTTFTVARATANTNITLNYCGSDIAAEQLMIYSPFKSMPTATRTTSTSDINGAQPYHSVGYHNRSLSYTGFTIYNPTSPRNVTGSLVVYGLKQ